MYNNERKSGILSFTQKLFDYMYNFKDFSRSKLKEYKYDMYQRNYLGWLGSCVIKGTDGVETPVKPRNFVTEIDDLHTQISYLDFFHYLLWVVIGFISFEIAMVFMHRNDGLSKGIVDKMIYARRAITLCIEGYLIFSLVRLFAFNSHDLLRAVDEHKCTNDEVVQASVSLMRKYADAKLGAGSGPLIMTIVFLILLGVTMFASLGYKVTVCEAAFNEDAPDADKQKSVRDPLVDNE